MLSEASHAGRGFGGVWQSVQSSRPIGHSSWIPNVTTVKTEHLESAICSNEKRGFISRVIASQAWERAFCQVKTTDKGNRSPGCAVVCTGCPGSWEAQPPAGVGVLLSGAHWFCGDREGCATCGTLFWLWLPGISEGSLGEGRKSVCGKKCEHSFQRMGHSIRVLEDGQKFTAWRRGSREHCTCGSAGLQSSGRAGNCYGACALEEVDGSAPDASTRPESLLTYEFVFCFCCSRII